MFGFHTAPLLPPHLPVLEEDFSPISAMGILNEQPLLSQKKMSCEYWGQLMDVYWC